MKFTRLNLIAIALFTVSVLQAQRDESLFGPRHAAFTGIWGGVTHNYSAFEDDWSYLRGGHFGFEFGNAILLGWSGAGTRDEVSVNDVTSTFNLKYNGFLVGYSPMSGKVVHPRINLLTGRGRLNVNENGDDRVFVLQPSAGIEVNVFQWFRVGLEGGYRIVDGIDKSALRRQDVSSPFAQLDLRFGFSWGR
ncbi:MAG: hypothetical protein HUU34_11065 [Saprospiraceae bacterium]|jgi:hypothetical protein|nr:hypothetical protein [Saprospiraceae bacterium]